MHDRASRDTKSCIQKRTVLGGFFSTDFENTANQTHRIEQGRSATTNRVINMQSQDTNDAAGAVEKKKYCLVRDIRVKPSKRQLPGRDRTRTWEQSISGKQVFKPPSNTWGCVTIRRSNDNITFSVNIFPLKKRNGEIPRMRYPLALGTRRQNESLSSCRSYGRVA
jgi:hypothetical protein